MGGSCGIVYLMGGSLIQCEYAIENMIGDVAGIICDGAKASCSLKVSSSVSAALKAALLALDNVRVTEEQGINDKNVEQVINNLGILASDGMANADSTILNIMTSKKG
jgi:L-cysteine desulfidase